MSDNSNEITLADLSAKIDALVDANKEIFERLKRVEKAAKKKTKK